MAYREFSCPTCGASLLYDSENGAATVICESCNHEWNVKDLENRLTFKPEVMGAGNGMNTADAAAVSYIDDSESALAFLNNYFENFNWDEFMMTSALSVPTIDKIVEKLIVKQGASATTWQLQFTSIAKPLIKKINGLKTLETRFFEEYVKTGDYTEGFVHFDAYKNIAYKLSVNKEKILKQLNNSIKYYKKYIANGGNNETLGSLTLQLDRITADLQEVKTVKTYTDLAGYAKAKDDFRKKLVAELSEKGMDAENVYIHAVSDYRSGGDSRTVLAAFQSIAGYKDADEYINKINTLFEFEYSSKEATLVRIGNKHYVFRVPEVKPFDPTAKGPEGEQPAEQAEAKKAKKGCGKKKVAEEQPKATDAPGSYSMYEIVDTVEQKEPKATGITCFLRNTDKNEVQGLVHYGGYLVYIKNHTQLCIFNSNATGDTPAETVIYTGKPGDFEYGDSKIYFFLKGKYFFFLNKLNAVKEEKNGCFKRIFGKKKKVETRVSNKNNFSLLAFDMSTGETKTAVPELVDIAEIIGNHIFYTMVKVEDGKEREDFYAFDINRKTSEAVLDADTELVTVIDGKIIYFQYTPNSLNRDMYALNMMTGDKQLLDYNIYAYYRTINGKLYYRVGNRSYNTLYSINPDGSDKTEIMQNANRLGEAELRNGWLYLVRGTGLNAMLNKVSVKGGEEITVCPHFKRRVCFSDGYIYYIDARNSLCVVREDGKDWKVVLPDVGKVLNITQDAIYLLKYETVGVVDVSEKSYSSNSLYKVDVTGHNLTKIAFDISTAKVNNYNENEIYLYRALDKRYRLSTPIDKDNYAVTYETHNIKSIVLYDTAKNTFTDIAVFGKPEAGQSRTFKSGCFGRKKTTKECILEEVPHKIKFVREGMLKAGTVGEAQVEEAEIAQAETEAAAKANKGCGNQAGKANKGCGSKK